jgi:enoyl-CoA hydratase/carnithine racemase
MTLSQFSIACGATPKWVQNAARILGRSLHYSADEARHLGLAKQIHEDLQIPLEVADRLATEALEQPGLESRTVGCAPTARVTVDVHRYLSDHAVRLARAMSHHQPRWRGRQPREGAGAVARARDHGWDIGLLESSLRATPADRIRRLNENMEFVRALRARR